MGKKKNVGDRFFGFFAFVHKAGLAKSTATFFFFIGRGKLNFAVLQGITNA